MSNRSMVEVFNIVKGYHYLYKVDGQNFMCTAAKAACRNGEITEKEACKLVTLIKEEMQEYVDYYASTENNYKVYDSTTLYSVIMETLDYSVDIEAMVEGIIPSWWDSFYEKLKLLEE